MKKHETWLGLLSLILLCSCLGSVSEEMKKEEIREALYGDVEKVFQKYELLGLSVVLIEDAEVSWQGHYGTTHPDTTEKINGNTKYRIASISKIVTTIAVMQLVDRGLVHLDEDVSKYLGWKLRNPEHPEISITLRHLFSHTSGIRDGKEYPQFLQDMIPKKLPISELFLPEGVYFTEDLFDARRPGEFFSYANCAWGIVASVVEIISEQRFDEYCREHIFSPMEITSSFNLLEIYEDSSIAGLYRYIDNQWVNQVDDYRHISPKGRSYEGYTLGQNGLLFGPQGNLRASSDDLVAMVKLFLNGGSFNGNAILSEISTEKMLGEQWVFDGTNGDTWDGFFNSYGFGIHRVTNQPNQDIVFPDRQMQGHPGIAYGLLSDLYFNQETQSGIIFITSGSKQEYQYGQNSSFYGVEEEVFEAVYPYLNKISSISN